MSKHLRTYEIVGRPLVRNGRRLSTGTKVRLHPADGDLLVARGRLKASSGKATDGMEDAVEAAESLSGSPSHANRGSPAVRSDSGAGE